MIKWGLQFNLPKIGFHTITLLLLLGTAILGMVGTVNAQSVDGNWNLPVNISRSGSATDPHMVVDATGIIHVLWKDDFSGYVYVEGDGTTWSDPLAVTTPFYDEEIEYNPWIFAGNQGYVHAFWTDEENTLLYSRVEADRIDTSAWDAGSTVTDNALTLAVTDDANGRLHLVYVRTLDTAEFPSGIYYRRSGIGGVGWSEAQLLYASPYYREIEEVTDAHVDISTSVVGESVNVYVAWDNLPRTRVYMASSKDGGDTWSEPWEVDKPETETGATTPSNPLVYTQGEQVLLLWRVSHQELGCTYYFQWSANGGETWQQRQQMFEGLLGCPDNVQVMEQGNNPLLLIDAVQSYLQIWDGTRWSSPQLQNPLNSFTDEETQRLVEFDCHEAVMVNEEDIYVAGCDASLGGDIWVLQRQIGEVDSWFPEDPVWNPLISVTEDQAGVANPTVVSDNSNLLHVFWAQPLEAAQGAENAAIYYARWEGERQWSQPVAVIANLDGDARQPSAAAGRDGNLYLVWSEGRTGAVNFSAVNANRAAFPDDWPEPVALPLPQSSGSSPDILVDRQGKIYVTLAVPLNEGRGIYLTSSEDGGASWSDMVKVFDAQAEGWDMVDNPHIALTNDNHLHLFWSQNTLPSGPGTLALYYARSEDGGLTWSTAEQVTDKPSVWSEIVGGQGSVVHRLWQESTSSGVTVWHDLSLDDGLTWTRSAPVSIFGDVTSYSSLVEDRAQRLHLLQAVNRGTGNFSVQHWLWDSAAGWAAQQNLDFSLDTTAQVGTLTSGFSQSGDLAVLFSESSISPENGQLEDTLYFTRRTVSDLPPEEPIQPLPAAPTTTATTPPTSTPLPTLRPTTEPTQEQLLPTEQATNPTNNGLLVGGLLVGFVIVVGSGFGLWFLRDSRR